MHETKIKIDYSKEIMLRSDGNMLDEWRIINIKIKRPLKRALNEIN